jgi:hydrogenase maturation protease
LIRSAVPRTGVFGFGNPLRRDDGVGWHVADAVRRCWPAIIVRTAQQPVPEWAADLAELDIAYFVDASIRSHYLRIQHITAARHVGLVEGHTLSPEMLVHLTLSVYGQPPDVYLLHVPAEDFAFGGEFSITASRGAASAIALLNRRIARVNRR